MLTRTKHIRRHRLIGLLMVASELLLLFLIGIWLASQYNEASQRMHLDVQNLFDRTESRITDSLLNNALRHMLADSANVPDPGVTSVRLNISGGTQPAAYVVSGGRRHGTIKVAQFAGSLSETPQVVRDSAQIGKLMKKVMRSTFTLLNDKNGSPGRIIINDSGLLKEHFSQVMRQSYPHITVAWSDSAPADGVFIYRQASKAEAAELKGYSYYLLQYIWPQLAFSVLLIVLTGAAFLLAYRTINRQIAFGIQKDNFISNISHELKTPVTTTQAALEALTHYGAMHDTVRSQKYLDIAGWEMNRLRTLIDRIIDTMQIEDGQVVLEKESIHISQLIRDLVQTLQPIFDEKQVSVTWNIPDENLTCNVDRIHFTNAFYNLLDNAVKYGGTEIKIELYAVANGVALRVADNGAGISGDQQAKVFEKFYRVPGGNVHNTKGHGLGLSYTQYIIHMHGGTIKLQSEKGRGTAFTIFIPKSLPDEL